MTTPPAPSQWVGTPHVLAERKPSAYLSDLLDSASDDALRSGKTLGDTFRALVTQTGDPERPICSALASSGDGAVAFASPDGWFGLWLPIMGARARGYAASAHETWAATTWAAWSAYVRRAHLRRPMASPAFGPAPTAVELVMAIANCDNAQQPPVLALLAAALNLIPAAEVESVQMLLAVQGVSMADLPTVVHH